MRTQKKWLFLLFVCLLLSALCLLVSCGKKGDPTLKSYEKPPPPSALKAIHRESEIILLWDFPKDNESAIKGFHLMKMIPSAHPLEKGISGDFKKFAFLENDKRSYRDADFKAGSEYKYKIVSLSLKDVISNDSNIIEIKPGTSPLPPQNISFKVFNDSLTLSWESSGEGIFYNIYKSDKQGLYSLFPVNKEPVQGTSFKDTFDFQKPVYYTVRSLTTSNIRDEGPASEEIKADPFDFVPSAPNGLQAIATKEAIYLLWKEPPETWVVAYRVYCEMKKNEGFILIGESITPSFIDKNNPFMKRNYRVTAMGPAREGPPAEISNIVYVKAK
jgi:fibronectin type 3 domain-containing protein